MTIRIHIEQLVVQGLPLDSLGAGRLRAALVAELGAQLAAGGLGAELRSGATLVDIPIPGQVRVPSSEPYAVGRGVAGAVAGALRGG